MIYFLARTLYSNDKIIPFHILQSRIALISQLTGTNTFVGTVLTFEKINKTRYCDLVGFSKREWTGARKETEERLFKFCSRPLNQYLARPWNGGYKRQELDLLKISRATATVIKIDLYKVLPAVLTLSDWSLFCADSTATWKW